jgi:hypothetical protein
VSREVDHFINSSLPAGAAIDLLVVSHFDGDHINHLKLLLHGGRKVKKLIAPFIGLEERVTLSLRYMSEYYSENDPNPEFTCDCIIDITKALSDNLDGDSEVILIAHDPDNTPSDEEGNIGELNLNDQKAIEFHFRGKIASSFAEMKLTDSSASIYNALDSQIGKIKAFDVDIIDFIFYTKNIGPDEKVFFRKVYDSFIAKFFPDTIKPPTIQEIVDKIKLLKGGTIIKDIFSACYSGLDLSESKTDIKNLNTTALCLLHKNRPSVIKKLVESGPRIALSPQINLIRFLTGAREREPLYNFLYPYIWGLHWWRMRDIEHNPIHANVLLTSDSFLKKASEVNAFIRHYQNFWKQFFIFQIPHHGSRKSADKNLFSSLPLGIIKFMNYGINHQFISQWSHPSPEVISDLGAASQGIQNYGVNENMGLEIILRIEQL